MTAADLAGLDRRALRSLLCAGHPIDPAALAGREYRGVSLGLPRIVERLTWKKFKKVFHRDGAGLRGWNVRVVQNGLDAPWIDRPRPRATDGEPLTFGPFRVVDPAGFAMPAPAGGGLLLDYGAEANPPLLRRLRDPIVALTRGDARLLLGWSYLDFGFARLGTPSFFSLEDDGPTRFIRPSAPSR